MANAASITRQIKQVVGDRTIRVHSRYTQDESRRDVWQTFIWAEPEQHAALIARLADAGLDRVTCTEFFLDVVQAV